MNWDTWGPPLVVLGVGLGVGLVLALRSRGDATAQDGREALAARKELLVEELRELEADRGKIGDAAFLAQKEALVTEAAAVLRALEDPSAAPRPAPAASPAARGGALVWIGVAVAFFALLGAGLTQFTAPRDQGRPMTGGASSADAAAASAAVTAAEAALAADPKDIDALNTLTWEAIRTGDLSGAMGHLNVAREVAPDDPLVLTHLAVHQLQIGMTDRAEEGLMRAIAAQPGLARAHLWLALLRYQQGDREAAEASIATARQAGPSSEEQAMAQSLLAEIRAPPPSVMVAGTVALGEGVAVPEGGTLFITARRAADGGGPPVAAKRGSVPAFPVEFDLTDRDMMMGGEWPAEVWVQARVDADGNPTSRSPEDVESPLVGPFAAGGGPIALVLGGGAGAAQGAADAAPADDAPAASGSARIGGTIALADGAPAPAGGVLFVIARRSEAGGGPPVAALRLPITGLPTRFSFSDGDMMMGGVWPDEVWLQARIDADGNPTSRSADDIESPVLGPLRVGETAAQLVLGGG